MSEAGASARRTAPFDWLLHFAILALTAGGAVMVYSASAITATRNLHDEFYFLTRQAVAFAIGVLELTFQARQMQEDSEQGIETFLAVTLLYFLCAFLANRIMAVIEARTRVPGFMGAAK